MQRGDCIVVRTTLHEGNYCKIAASGCEDAYDVDLVGEDDDTSDLAVVDLVPAYTGTFFLKITLANSTANGAHWVVQYAYRNL